MNRPYSFIMGETVRAEITFRGHVQGVGFRFVSRNIATRYRLDGYVKNMPDGTVFLACEGSKNEVESCLDEINKTMLCYLKSSDVEWGDPTGEFAGFDIRV